MQLMHRHCSGSPLQCSTAMQLSRQPMLQPTAQLRGQAQRACAPLSSRNQCSMASTSSAFQAGASFLDDAAARLLSPSAAELPARPDRSRATRWASTPRLLLQTLFVSQRGSWSFRHGAVDGTCMPATADSCMVYRRPDPVQCHVGA